MSKQTIYDAIIIGSGASGGMAAKELTAKGFRVLVLEAGPPVIPLRDFTSHNWPYEVMYRGFGPPGWKARDPLPSPGRRRHNARVGRARWRG